MLNSIVNYGLIELEVVGTDRPTVFQPIIRLNIADFDEDNESCGGGETELKHKYIMHCQLFFILGWKYVRCLKCQFV
jgi:hypothetical protein